RDTRNEPAAESYRADVSVRGGHGHLLRAAVEARPHRADQVLPSRLLLAFLRRHRARVGHVSVSVEMNVAGLLGCSVAEARVARLPGCLVASSVIAECPAKQATRQPGNSPPQQPRNPATQQPKGELA